MAVRRIVPNIRASSGATPTDFYTRILGLDVEMDFGWIITFGSPVARQAQISVLTRDATGPVVPDVSIEVDDLDSVHDRCVEAGLRIVHPLTMEAWGVRRFFVEDPNGKVINILSHECTETS